MKPTIKGALRQLAVVALALLSSSMAIGTAVAPAFYPMPLV